MPPPVLTLRDAEITFGGAPLFSGVDVSLSLGEKTCLVGRNGCGKSTLLKVLAGLIDLDDGDRFTQPGTTIAYLPQDPVPEEGQTVAAFIESGLHDIGLPPEEADARHFRVRDLLTTMQLDGTAIASTLSGGEMRRAALARAFVGDPDVLLLDEPTNHLDIATIDWLEKTLASMPAAVLTISHDRAFLRRLSRRMLWMDRGRLRTHAKGYEAFDDWVDEVFTKEEAENRRLEKRIAAETKWLHRGVTARRKRNQGRLRELQKLRERRAKQIKEVTRIDFELEDAPPASRRLIEARNIAKAYGDAPIVEGFSTRIMRGDRVGIVGPNGAGKTTLIRMLTGDLTPDSGSVKLAKTLEAAYFDQTRAQLNPKRTLWETLTEKEIGGGGDSVNVQGRTRHVVAYLKDFLFDDKQARQPVGALSGGEKNRLLLAKLFTKPANLLVLDEPTNDLDMDMLDMLEDILDGFDGTVLLISHDRDFLDRTVTSIISFDPDGQVREYPGGYTDMLRQRKKAVASGGNKVSDAEADQVRVQPSQKPVSKMTYKDKRALDLLPVEIEKLERDAARIEAQLADPQTYQDDPDAIPRLAKLLDTARRLIAEKQDRWLELELQREELEGAE